MECDATVLNSHTLLSVRAEQVPAENVGRDHEVCRRRRAVAGFRPERLPRAGLHPTSRLSADKRDRSPHYQCGTGHTARAAAPGEGLLDQHKQRKRTISRTISIQQQPRQKRPCRIPFVTAPNAPWRGRRSRNASGERQCRRQACFNGVHCSIDAAIYLRSLTYRRCCAPEFRAYALTFSDLRHGRVRSCVAQWRDFIDAGLRRGQDWTPIDNQ